MQRLTPQGLRARVESLPRVPLGQFPTPLERWERLQGYLNRSGRFYAKREDLSGLAFGGNKVRQLEFLLGDALSVGADVVVNGAAVQSNHCRVLAAAANKLGLGCHLVLSRAYNQPEDQGNALLDRVLGASIELTDEPLGPELEAHKLRVAERLATAGHRPYVIGGETAAMLGTIAYVAAAIEILAQCVESEHFPKWVVTSSMGCTQGGVLLGLRLLGCEAKVLGFAPLRREESPAEAPLWEGVVSAARRLGVGCPVSRNEVSNVDDYTGPSYARIMPEAMEAIKLIARTEGVFLDPVYTGKAMAGTLDLINKGRIPRHEDVLFIHTGGNVALFAYNRELLDSA